MLQDGAAPVQVLRPRQQVGAGSSSTTLSTVSYSTASATTTLPATLINDATFVSTAAFSIITSDLDDPDDSSCVRPLPSGGIIRINDTFALYLDSAATFVAPCENQTIEAGNCSNSTVVPFGDPFYASISPQIYALATATVISYVLVILIFITPRTFFVGTPGGSGATHGPTAGLRTLFPGAVGRNPGVIGVGRRPLLQKIAAITVAVSLTIATADTFSVAKQQYHDGYINSSTLVTKVVGRVEIRVIRVISDTFLWLAQVQTLIRLFPRHKEKVTIKWLGFGLVLCDTVFSILENFVSQANKTRPRSFTDAIPALSYLFELAIGLIYASCVLYYSLSKRRFAFYHPKMRNVFLVAILSLLAVMIPVVFFILDVAQPDIATWGEYIRWVGAAAASVVVWEWVERIEALERDEKKDGILGREIFDGDEMLDATASEVDFHPDQSRGPGGREQKKANSTWRNVRDLNIHIQPNISLRRWKKSTDAEEAKPGTDMPDEKGKSADTTQIRRPPQVATPISRSDTNSAASTVYAVRYHDPFSPSPAIPEDRVAEEAQYVPQVSIPQTTSDETTTTDSIDVPLASRRMSQAESTNAVSTGRQIWQGVSNPFKRKRTEPPAEVAAQIADSNNRRSPIDVRLNLKNRLGAFATAQKNKQRRSHKSTTPLPVTVIPAQRRGSRTPRSSTSEEGDSVASHAENVQNPSLATTERETSNTLNVTVIPAPVRGGRTWSPDDLPDSRQGSTTTEEDSPTRQNGAAATQDQGPTPGAQSPPHVSHSQRIAFGTSDSPSRLRDSHTPSNDTPSLPRRSRNNRSATIGSISDRLDSVSPAVTSASSAPRTGTADSVVRQSATTDIIEQQTLP